MPLILLNGLPSSGKSKTAELIGNFIKSRFAQDGIDRQVRIVSDSELLDWDGRNVIYMSIPKEKELRGWLRSEVQRFLNMKQVVILDAAAYIKGFRYELFCIAKEASTQYCVVEINLDKELCWRWNLELIEKQPRSDDNSDLPGPGYTRQTFDALVMRYEKCDETNRWDSPLFQINSESEKIDMEKIYEVITKGEPLVPNKCTSYLA